MLRDLSTCAHLIMCCRCIALRRTRASTPPSARSRSSAAPSPTAASLSRAQQVRMRCTPLPKAPDRVMAASASCIASEHRVDMHKTRRHTAPPNKALPKEVLPCIPTLPSSCWIRYLAAGQSADQNSSSSTHPITDSLWRAAQVRCGCWTSVPIRRRCRAAAPPPPASPSPTDTTAAGAAPHRSRAAAAADVGELTTAPGDWHGVTSAQLFC